MDYRLPFLPDEHQFAIAAVTTRGGELDTTLEFVIRAALWNLPATAKYALRNLGSDRIVGLARAALEDSFRDEHDEIARIFDLVGKARSDRNDIIHWLWRSHESDASLAQIRRMRPFREPEERTLSAAQIYAVAEALEKAQMACFSWFDRFDFIADRLSEPSSDKPERPSPPGNSTEHEGAGLLGSVLPPEPTS